MISTYWLKIRKPHWDRLEALLKQSAQHGMRALTRGEMRELGLLYRQIASDLSTAREDPGAQNYARYLNQLLGRTHNIIYAGKKTDVWGILRFYGKIFPQVFRRNFPYVLAAFILFLAGGMLATLVSLKSPQFTRMFLGGPMMDTIERREMWTHSIVAIRPLASSGIMTNNLSVSFATYAMGITAGIGTIYMLFFNGVLMGVISTACWQAGMSLKLWSFVAPHGVLELPAIFLAGGAGLLLAKGLLFPGFLPRRESVRLAGAESVRLALGCIPLLILAGLIEGFLSPTSLHASLKFLVASVLAMLLAAYLTSRFGEEPTTGSAPSPASTD